MRTVEKLEYVPVPEYLTSICLVPTPPLNAEAMLEYTATPAYAEVVLGTLDFCNAKLEKIQELMTEGVSDHENNREADW